MLCSEPFISSALSAARLEPPAQRVLRRAHAVKKIMCTNSTCPLCIRVKTKNRLCGVNGVDCEGVFAIELTCPGCAVLAINAINVHATGLVM